MSDPNLAIEYIRLFSVTNGGLRLSQALPELAKKMGASRIELLTADDRPVHRGKLLANALSEARAFRIEFDLTAESAPPSNVASDEEAFPVPGGPEGLNAQRPDDLLVRFLREFDKLERHNEFMWIGFVLKTLLPQLGLAEHEVRAFIQKTEADGVIMMNKEPNPRRPEFPTTRVRLNREHPLVRSVLNAEAQPRRRFPIGSVPGPPLSEAIIRERR